MLESIFEFLVLVDDVLWAYAAFSFIIFLGLWLTFQFKFGQITQFPKILNYFWGALRGKHKSSERGVHPLAAFFSSIGGCLGIGNIVAVRGAVQIGGPGAVFWMWVAAFFGMVIKYCEVYLGIRYRVQNKLGGYDGGPMYYLKQAFKSPTLSVLSAVFLCIYGTEIYMFNTITESVSTNWELPRYAVITVLLAMVVLAGTGGVKRVGMICSAMIPLFIVIFTAMCGYVLALNWTELPQAFFSIFKTAFTGHAAVGGFVGSTLALTISQGIARGCYTADVGIGFASVIHSESCDQRPDRQASLVIFDIFLDTFVTCSFSVLLILVTGIWREGIPASMLVQNALALYFPGMKYFMPFLLFLLGYSSMISFFCVGVKCARYLSPKFGSKIYHVYSVSAFIAFSFLETRHALLMMSLSGATLLIINLAGVFKLRDKVVFFRG